MRTALRQLRRLWPQRVGPRLTLTFAALFLLAGSVLLGLTYGLVAASLPGGPRAGLTRAQEASAAQLCQQKVGSAAKQKGAQAAIGACEKEAYNAGVGAGKSSQRDRALSKLLTYSLVGLGVMTCASGGLGWLVSRRVLAPVRTITSTARRASQEHLGERLALSGPRDELRELADTFDDMLDRLDQAFAAQKQFVANASHELRTPLTVMRTAVDVTLAKPEVTRDQLIDMAVRVRRSLESAQRMVDALLTLAVSEQGVRQAEYLDLSALAEDAIDQVRPAMEEAGVRLETELSLAGVRGTPELVERMVWNLVDNAVRHNEPGGWIRLTSGASDGAAFLRVANGGEFIPDAAVAGLLEPFRRLAGRSGPGGVGLGMSIVRSVSAVHGGTMEVSNLPAGGLDVLVRMPQATDEPVPEPGG